jgi:hypothetical protein
VISQKMVDGVDPHLNVVSKPGEGTRNCKIFYVIRNKAVGILGFVFTSYLCILNILGLVN